MPIAKAVTDERPHNFDLTKATAQRALAPARAPRHPHDDPYYEQIYGPDHDLDDGTAADEYDTLREMLSDETWEPDPGSGRMSADYSIWTSLLVFAVALGMIVYGLANVRLPQPTSCAAIAAAQARPAANEAEIVVINCTSEHYKLIQTGSAARVSPTQWISARHVVEAGKSDRIYLVDPERKAHRVASFKSHPTHDLVVMRLDKRVPGIVLDLADPQVDTKATAIGPAGETEDMSFRSLGTDSDSGVPVLVFDGEAHPGFSGGPIVNEAGQITGMTYAVQPESKLTLAVAPAQIRELLSESTS